MSRSLMCIGILLIFSAACSAPQAPPPPDVRVLMRTGRYSEAVAEAERLNSSGEQDPRLLALLAAARASAAAPTGSTETAANALLQAVAASSRGTAAQHFTAEVTGSMAFESNRFIAAAEVMLALAQGWQGGVDDVDALRGAEGILGLAAYGGEHQAPISALEPLIRAGAILLENSTQDLVFPDGQLRLAWNCFRATGSLAASTNDIGSNEASAAVAEIAIRIAEANPELAVAVACDIGSPRNRLRESLRRRHDAESMARLSAAMADAEGCGLGTYAP